MKRGFSLVEVLFALVVISCIVAAFTPLLTKKFSSNVLNNMEITTDCTDKFGENCTLCTSTYCIDCTSLSCPDGEYRDSKSCTCKKCSDTYGPDCTKCNDKKCLTCPDGQYLDDKNKCIDCSAKFSNCAKCTMSECTACDDGYALTDPVSNTPCSKFDCSGPDFIQIGSLCITKKNMGDGDSLIIPDGVNVVNVGTSCSPSASNFCCWKGNTSGSKCDNENGGAYSGCNRTVCDWYAADYICKNFKAGGKTWRLATIDEMADWATNSIGLGVNGLQLCDGVSGHSSAYCQTGAACNGSQYWNCDVSYVWSQTPKGAYSYLYMLTSGSWSSANYTRAAAFSVRCVTEMPSSCSDKFGNGCATCNNSKCLSCQAGYTMYDWGCASTTCASIEGCLECAKKSTMPGSDYVTCTLCAPTYTMVSVDKSDITNNAQCSLFGCPDTCQKN